MDSGSFRSGLWGLCRDAGLFADQYRFTLDAFGDLRTFSTPDLVLGLFSASSLIRISGKTTKISCWYLRAFEASRLHRRLLYHQRGFTPNVFEGMKSLCHHLTRFPSTLVTLMIQQPPVHPDAFNALECQHEFWIILADVLIKGAIEMWSGIESGGDKTISYLQIHRE